MSGAIGRVAPDLGCLPMEPVAVAMWGSDMADVAGEIMATHTDQDGFCLGCMNDFSFVVLYPCTRRQWAVRALVVDGERP